jgi:transcriptional regulator with XRE-family HTH domain
VGMNDMSAGEWLRNALAQRGISVREATEAVGLKATQAVYAWLSDKAAPTDEAAARLAMLLDVPEMEVRRRFNLWVPEEGDSQRPARNPEELDQIIEDLTAVLARFRKWRRGV